MSSPVLALLREWTGTQWIRSRETALSLLRGRGEGENVWTEGERVLHLRRPLSAAERDLLPSDELFIRAAVAFSMLMRRGDIMPEMAVIVPDLDGMSRDHAITTIALNFADATPSTKDRADLFATVLPDDYGEALQEAVVGNRRALGLPPQEQT